MFRDDADWEDIIARAAVCGEHAGLTVYACALLANQGYLPLRRHEHTGHLFQNRYKSIVV
jgi:hypothetical protein